MKILLQYKWSVVSDQCSWQLTTDHRSLNTFKKMSYLVLARKYRPQKFNELVGQEHIADLLSKAIETGRLSQAYLFCGPRGVGKTSCARILAKCLNCTKGPTLNPCGNCPACSDIAKGTSFDVLEIDGASNRGIDEIRTLRENVKFAPSYGKYKIYIVDEVHMLTMEAFNALLKTLEEPPEHVKFVFATTAPQKVPATILSRCQRFDFVRIPLKTIVDALEKICKKEDLDVSTDALYSIAKSAQGGMRDALSILDQLSALRNREINLEDVCSMLGLVEIQFLFDISQSIGEKNGVRALETLEAILSKGKDPKQLLKDLTEHFRNLMIIKIGGKTLGKLVDYPVNIKEMYLAQSNLFNLVDIVKAIDILIEAQDITRITESMQMPLEVALAKLTYSATAVSVPRPTSSISQPTITTPKQAAPKSQTYSPNNILSNQKGEMKIAPSPQAQSEVVSVSEEKESGEIFNEDLQMIDLEKIRRLWDTLTHAVSRQKMSIATFLQEGIPVEFKDHTLTVGFAKENNFHKESLEEKQNKMLLEKVFSEKLKSTIYFKFKIIDQQMPKQEDPIVKSALETLKGKVVNRWHN